MAEDGRAEEELVPDAETIAAEHHEATRGHQADRPPTEDEEERAERAAQEAKGSAADVAEHYEEMSRIGAHVKGEGRIE